MQTYCWHHRKTNSLKLWCFWGFCTSWFLPPTLHLWNSNSTSNTKEYVFTEFCFKCTSTVNLFLLTSSFRCWMNRFTSHRCLCRNGHCKDCLRHCSMNLIELTSFQQCDSSLQCIYILGHSGNTLFSEFSQKEAPVLLTTYCIDANYANTAIDLLCWFTSWN